MSSSARARAIATLTRKREIYEEAGVPSYWLVDPVPQTLTILSLEEGVYVQRARLTGEGELTVEQPHPVRVHAFRR